MRISGLRTSVIMPILTATVISVHASPIQLRDKLVERASPKNSTNDVKEAVYRMSSSPQVVLNLAGTTPLKDWTMSAHGLTGDARMVVTKDNGLLDILSLTFRLPVYNLKGEQRAMDDDCYAALKANRFREIVFVLISASVAPKREHAYSIAARGTLTVAGVTRFVTLKMCGEVASDGSITFNGLENLKMSDYNVERPSVFFGVIRAGDDMTLSYNLIFTKCVNAD
jgi:polyisoprenoid-binding protein YceI